MPNSPNPYDYESYEQYEYYNPTPPEPIDESSGGEYPTFLCANCNTYYEYNDLMLTEVGRLCKSCFNKKILAPAPNWKPASITGYNWKPNHKYMMGDLLTDHYGKKWVVCDIGVSSDKEPAWHTNEHILFDGGIRWRRWNYTGNISDPIAEPIKQVVLSNGTQVRIVDNKVLQVSHDAGLSWYTIDPTTLVAPLNSPATQILIGESSDEDREI
jgi:hypothetical protein